MAKELAREQFSDWDVDVFWSKVLASDAANCWPWMGGRNSQGYGAFSVRRRNVQAHRVAYALHYGLTPAHLIVMHRCDNPPCCNPAHLQLGTSMDNTQDMIRKGRKVVVIASPERRFDIGAWRVKNMPFIGSLHPRAKLNEDKVRLIKSALAAGEKGVDIARRFGCSVHTVSLINAGKQWRHVK